MKKIMKKGLSLFATIAIVLSLAVVPSFAEAAGEKITTTVDNNGNYTFVINDVDYGYGPAADFCADFELTYGWNPVMPGDSGSQAITITNNSDKVVKFADTYFAKWMKLSQNVSDKLGPEGVEKAIAFFWDECFILNNGPTSTFDFTAYVRSLCPAMELQPGASLVIDMASYIDGQKVDNTYASAKFFIGCGIAFATDSKPMPEYTVTKVWDDNNAADRPESVKIQLYNGQEAYGNPIELNKENNWTYNWTGITEQDNWSVKEIDVPTGYKESVTFDGQNNTFTLTNTKDRIDPPNPPIIPPVIDPILPPEPPVVVPPEEDDPGNNETPEPPVEEPGEDTDEPDDNNDATPPPADNDQVVDEDTSQNNNSDQPKTGDESQMALFIILVGGALAGMIALKRKA